VLQSTTSNCEQFHGRGSWVVDSVSLACVIEVNVLQCVLQVATSSCGGLPGLDPWMVHWVSSVSVGMVNALQ